jgi:hypothetical protein
MRNLLKVSIWIIRRQVGIPVNARQGFYLLQTYSTAMNKEFFKKNTYKKNRKASLEYTFPDTHGRYGFTAPR